MHVLTIETASLGDRSYIVHDGSVALVIDPQRDIDRVLAEADEAGVRITHVAETHVHNDYVSGGLALKRVARAELVHAADEPLRFDHTPARDGDTFTVGELSVEVLHTPGHTPHHLSYVVRHGDEAPAAFTGGSLLYGTVGRTDLISEERTDELTRKQLASARRLAEALPPETRIYPTHGFGSFCASAAAEEPSDGTLGREKEINIALTVDDEDAFVERLVSGLTAYPRYYAQMGPMNLAGGNPVDLSPPAPVDPVELARRLHRGEWVVDLRNRRAFAAEHLSGSIGIEISNSFSTYLGWLIPWATPITLLGDTEEEVAEAQRQLVRIGIDRPAGAAVGDGPAAWAPDHDRASYRVVDFRGMVARDGGTVLDVRQTGEFRDGHVEGSLHVPLHELLDRLDELPDDEELWVHCRSGFRASVAASLLDRAGKRVVLIDDHFDRAQEAGAELVRG